jgi:hypothetical protein
MRGGGRGSIGEFLTYYETQAKLFVRMPWFDFGTLRPADARKEFTLVARRSMNSLYAREFFKLSWRDT